MSAWLQGLQIIWGMLWQPLIKTIQDNSSLTHWMYSSRRKESMWEMLLVEICLMCFIYLLKRKFRIQHNVWGKSSGKIFGICSWRKRYHKCVILKRVKLKDTTKSEKINPWIYASHHRLINKFMDFITVKNSTDHLKDVWKVPAATLN